MNALLKSGSASAQEFVNRATKSGLEMNGRPKAIKSAFPDAIAASAVSLVYPALPIMMPL